MKNISTKLNRLFPVFLTILMVIQTSCFNQTPQTPNNVNLDSQKPLSKNTYTIKDTSNTCLVKSLSGGAYTGASVRSTPYFNITGTSVAFSVQYAMSDKTMTINNVTGNLSSALKKGGGAVSFNLNGTATTSGGPCISYQTFSTTGTAEVASDGTSRIEIKGFTTNLGTAMCTLPFPLNDRSAPAADTVTRTVSDLFMNGGVSYETITITGENDGFSITPSNNTQGWTTGIAGPSPSDLCPNVPKYQKSFSDAGNKFIALKDGGKFLANGLYAATASYDVCSTDQALSYITLNKTGKLSITAEPNPFILGNEATSTMNIKVTSDSLEPWNLTFNGPSFTNAGCKSGDQIIPWTVPANGQGNYTASATYVDAGTPENLPVIVQPAPTPTPLCYPGTVIPGVFNPDGSQACCAEFATCGIGGNPTPNPTSTSSTPPIDISIPPSEPPCYGNACPTPTPSNPAPTPTVSTPPTPTPSPTPSVDCGVPEPILQNTVYHGQGKFKLLSSKYTFNTKEEISYPCSTPTVETLVDGKENNIISPENEDGKFDNVIFDIGFSDSPKWILQVEGFRKIENIDGSVSKGSFCLWTNTGKGSNKNIIFNGKCDDGSWMYDGEYTATLKGAVENSFEPAISKVRIDNTSPVVMIDYQNSSLITGIVNLSLKIQDPLINEVKSGINEKTIPNKIKSVDNYEITINYNKDTEFASINNIPRNFHISSLSPPDQNAVDEVVTTVVIALGSGKYSSIGLPLQDNVGNKSICYTK